MICKVYCSRVVSGILFFLFVPVSLSSCRVQVEKPEGETPSGEKLDPNLPKDARLLDLFSIAEIIDFAKEPKYTKCTYEYYSLNEQNNEFLAEPNPNSSVSQYEYDSSGRKVMESYEYGSDSFRSKSITEWSYDDLGRVSKTTSGSALADGSSSRSSHCVYTYDGNSTRLEKWECFSGEKNEEANKTKSIEVEYNIQKLERTITQRSRRYSSSSSFLSIESVTTENHSDDSFSFATKTEKKRYKFDQSENSTVVDSVSNAEVLFENGKFSEFVKSRSDIVNDEKVKIDEEKCVLKDKKVQCEGIGFNDKGEESARGLLTYRPVLLKFRPSDVLVCTSPQGCGLSEQISLNELSLDQLLTSLSVDFLPGSEDSGSSSTTNADYGSALRPWMLESAPFETSLSKSASGTYSETKMTSAETNNGKTVTTIEQRREKNGEAKSKEELGDWKNVSKAAVVCEIN